ncbi:MAG: hypothetical protein WB715_05330 [Roseiarcus sp.]|uniref:hypothetical protein n=1 Tax=Roseiarcus sp. TaxID=1969460 RepID=UPI003C44E3F0
MRKPAICLKSSDDGQIDANDNAWLTNYGSKSITVFDKTGKPLTPPEGITFGGRLGLMQGVIVTPSGDVWILGIEKSQLVSFPKGDLTKGTIVCEGERAEPCKSFRAPFLAASHDRIAHSRRRRVARSLGVRSPIGERARDSAMVNGNGTHPRRSDRTPRGAFDG